MNSRTTLVGALCLSFLLGHEAHAADIRVGVYQNAPKIFFDEEGQARGIHIDLLQRIARAEGWRLTFEACTWSECLQRLEAGSLDIMPDVAYTASRSERFAFGDEPALHSWLEVYRHPDVRIRTITDLGGKRISVIPDSLQAQVIRDIEAGFDVEIDTVTVSDFDAGFRAVEAGRADAVIVNHFYGDYQSSRYNLAHTPLMFQPSSLYFAAPADGPTEYLARIDAHLTAWKADPGSPYYQAITNWSDRALVTVVPAWVWWAASLAGALLALALLGVALLRREVKRRTADLQAQNQQLADLVDELTRTRQKAMDQERLHMIGEMTAGIAHDFNNALMLIIGHAEMLQEELESNDDSPPWLAPSVAAIGSAASDAAAVVGRMQTFYRKQQPTDEPESVDLNELARSLVEITRPRWDNQAQFSGIELHVDLDLEATRPAIVSRYQVQEVLLNLIMNAFDAMPDGGRLTIRSRCKGERVVIDVEDNGEGMSEDLLADCLKPFYTTKDNGTGMGLSVVNSLVTRNEGTLGIQSTPGEGSTFTLSFPASTDDEASAPEPESAADPLDVFIVDDDSALLGMLENLLTGDGHRVSIARTPREALRHVQAHHVDVALLDMVMPTMNGIELATRMRANGFSAPIVLVTGASDQVSEATHDVIDRLLEKPVSRARIRRVLSEVAAGK